MDYASKLVVYKNFIDSAERDYLYQYAMQLYKDGHLMPDVWYAKDIDKLQDAKGTDNTDTIKRYRLCVSNHQYYTLELAKIHERIINKLGLEEHWIDPIFGFLVAIVFPGGSVQPHNDSFITSHKLGYIGKFYCDKIHIRFNIMVDRDMDKSYDPHIIESIREVNEEKKYKQAVIVRHPVGIKDAWCFPAGHMGHMTPKLVGTKPRVTYQFGFAIPNTIGVDLERLSTVRY